MVGKGVGLGDARGAARGSQRTGEARGTRSTRGTRGTRPHLARDLDELPLLEQAEGVEHARDEARDGGLAGAGVAEEEHVIVRSSFTPIPARFFRTSVALRMPRSISLTSCRPTTDSSSFSRSKSADRPSPPPSSASMLDGPRASCRPLGGPLRSAGVPRPPARRIRARKVGVGGEAGKLGILNRDVEAWPRRAAEVALAAVLAVAVGDGALPVEAHAAHLLALCEVRRPDVHADAVRFECLLDNTVADVDLPLEAGEGGGEGLLDVRGRLVLAATAAPPPPPPPRGGSMGPCHGGRRDETCARHRRRRREGPRARRAPR